MAQPVPPSPVTTPSVRERFSAAWRALSGKPSATVSAPADVASAPTGARRIRRVSLGSYRGAEYSRITGDFMSRTQSPVEQLRADLRILRGRARDLANNDPLAKKYLSVMIAQVLGPRGPRLQAQVRKPNGDLDEVTNARIEAAWEDWSCGAVSADRTMNLQQFEALSFRSMIADGESFTRLVVGPEFRHGLALQGIDADLVDETYTVLNSGGGNEVWLGVEVDSRGVRQAYHLFDGNYSTSFSTRPRKRVAASEMMHCYHAERFGQARGVTWFAPVMVPIMHLNGYIEAVMVGARAAAGQMAFVTQDAEHMDQTAPESESGENQTLPAEMEIAPGTVTRLAPGEAVTAFNPGQPTDLFDPFSTTVCRFIATGLQVSYASLTGDYSRANYSSEKAARHLERIIVKMTQQAWAFTSRRPMYERWLETSVLSGRLQLPTPEPKKYTQARWHMQGVDWVDPGKDIEAAKLELQLGLTTVTRILAEKGEDFEGVMREIKRERELAKSLGVDLGTMISMAGKSAAVGAPAAAPDATDQEETPQEPESPAEDDGEDTEA